MAAHQTPLKLMAEPNRARNLRKDAANELAGVGLRFDVVPEQVAADPVALETWTHLAEVFAGMPQRFREGDRPLVAAYCMTVSMVRLADQQVRRDGLLVPGRLDVAVRNPAATVLNQQLGHLRQLGRELGLSPASRTMIGAADQPDVADRDELDELFG